ncbi:chaperonin 10-like protein [Mycena olivaceomarginata]|nr:chaperonin 10-like protein [Mycena olivaceomarginata]
MKRSRQRTEKLEVGEDLKRPTPERQSILIAQPGVNLDRTQRQSPKKSSSTLYIPEDYPVPGKTVVYDTTETIDLESVPLNGGILIKVLLLSLDPYMRGRLRAPEIESYMPAFPLGQPLTGGGIGVVLRSEDAAVKAGTHVRGWLAHQEYYIAPNLSMLEVIERDPKLDWSVYIGAAGMPGETVFAGWRKYSEAKKGEVAFITTGAGPVGSMVIQIAKQDGVKVIASAGSEEKVKFMKEISADVVFNYKTTDVREVLKKEGPIDMIQQRLPAHEGCLLLRPKNSAAFQTEVVPKLVSGEYKYTEDVSKGLDKVGDVLLAIQKGTNKGKAIVWVADE